jgi:ribosome-associated protein
MRTALEGARQGAPHAELLSEGQKPAALLQQIVRWLDEAKAEDIVTIDLAGKSSIGDFMVVATGGSDRHVGAIADQIGRKLKELGLGRVRIEGKEACDWVLIDTGDIIVHVFREEVREFYNLEKMWSADRPGETTTTAH